MIPCNPFFAAGAATNVTNASTSLLPGIIPYSYFEIGAVIGAAAVLWMVVNWVRNINS